MNNLNIAIDGPAGAGKSTIAKALAERLAYVYVDTGAMYRAIGYYVHQQSDLSLDLAGQPDEEELKAVDAFIDGHLNDIAVDIRYEGGKQQIILNGKNVSDSIRTAQMGTMASIVSANPKVRTYLVKLQQQLAKKTRVVMDGRDIGTHVLPDAGLKIYLTASVEVRARRRYDELVEKGENPEFDQLKKEIQERDYRDKNREFAPLRQAVDARRLDTSDMNIEEVVDALYTMAVELTGE